MVTTCSATTSRSSLATTSISVYVLKTFVTSSWIWLTATRSKGAVQIEVGVDVAGFALSYISLVSSLSADQVVTRSFAVALVRTVTSCTFAPTFIIHVKLIVRCISFASNQFSPTKLRARWPKTFGHLLVAW